MWQSNTELVLTIAEPLKLLPASKLPGTEALQLSDKRLAVPGPRVASAQRGWLLYDRRSPAAWGLWDTESLFHLLEFRSVAA